MAVNDQRNNNRIWMKEPTAVTPIEYNQFFKDHFGETTSPHKYFHHRNAHNQFALILFLPSQPIPPGSLRLSLISDGGLFCGDIGDTALPDYLKFIRGCVFKPGITGVPAELELASHQARQVIERRALVLAEDLPANLFTLYESSIKEWFINKIDSRKTLLNVLRFATTFGEESLTLAQYQSYSPDRLRRYFYVFGQSVHQLKTSSVVKRLVARGFGALLLIKSIDPNLMEILRGASEKFIEWRSGRRLWEDHFVVHKRPMYTDWLLAEKLSELTEVGDVIELSNGAYSHFAVVVEDLYTICGVRIIELAIDEANRGANVLINLNNNTYGVVRERDFFIAAGQRLCRIANSMDDVCVPSLKRDIANRARSEVGQHNYNLAVYNCEIFANEMRYGQRISRQVDNAIGGILATGMALGCAML